MAWNLLILTMKKESDVSFMNNQPNRVMKGGGDVHVSPNPDACGGFKFIYSTLGLQNKAFTRGGMKNVSF